MNDEQLIGKDLEGSGYGIIEEISWNLPVGIRKTSQNPSQDSWCVGRDSNQASPEYKSVVLLLHQPAR
jgi:hypothetical protein